MVRSVPMIQKPDTFRTLIERLGGVSRFAEKIGAGAFAAKKMRDRNSIAVRHWPEVIAASHEAGLDLSTDDLVGMKLRSEQERSRLLETEAAR